VAGKREGGNICARFSAPSFQHCNTHAGEEQSEEGRRGKGRGETRAVWERCRASSTRKEAISFSSQSSEVQRRLGIMHTPTTGPATTPHQHAHHTRTEPVVSGSCAFTSSRAFRDSARPGQGRRSSAHPPCTAYCGHCGGPAAVIARWRGVSKTT
jgi:hypothetical protein